MPIEIFYTSYKDNGQSLIVRYLATSPEKALGRCLWTLGLRYRKNYKGAVGKPDFAVVRAKVAIFCDGDFWHGNNWRIRGMRSLEEELSRYDDFWREKILKNIARDRKVDAILKKEGWKVFRFWESEIKKNPQKFAGKVFRLVKKRRFDGKKTQIKNRSRSPRR